MTPKERAKELYDKMYWNCTMTIAGAGSIWKPLVKKQCAIVVDEMLASLSGVWADVVVTTGRSCQDILNHQIYLAEVKEEINNL